MIYYIIKLNAVYDILCALCILNILDIPVLNTIHISMLIDKHSDISQRFFAYWIFTYGCMRLSNDPFTVKMSYGIEALCIANEYLIYSSIKKEKAIFVILCSLILAALS